MCWQYEDNNIQSQRQIENARHYAGNRVSLAIGNLCNYRCRICGPDSSSKLSKEWEVIFGEKKMKQDWYKEDYIWQDVLRHHRTILFTDDCTSLSKVLEHETWAFTETFKNKLLNKKTNQ